MAKLQFGNRKQALFSLWAREAGETYERLERELLNAVDALRIGGVADDEILRRLSRELEEGTGVFSRFRGEIEGKADRLLNQTSQLSSVETLEDGGFAWQLDPTVQEHCGTCLSNSEKGSMPFSDWDTIGLPGMGNTDCGIYCRCSLERG